MLVSVIPTDAKNPSYAVTYTPDLCPRPVNDTLPTDFSFHLSMSQIKFIFTHKIEIAKEEGTNER